MSTFEVFAYFNQNSRNAMRDGYSATDEVQISTIGPKWFEAENIQGAAEQMFKHMNADNRPNGQTERSLSVGDVLRIQRLAPELAYPYITAYLAVEGIGFSVVNPPRTARKAS